MSTRERHPATTQLVRWFEFEHLPSGLPRDLSRHCAGLAARLVEMLPDGPGPVKVSIPKRTHDALVALGWTPPAGEP